MASEGRHAPHEKRLAGGSVWATERPHCRRPHDYYMAFINMESTDLGLPRNWLDSGLDDGLEIGAWDHKRFSVEGLVGNW